MCSQRLWIVIIIEVNETMRRVIFIISMLLAVAAVRAERVWTPEDMVNPNVSNRYDFVADPGGLLDETTKRGVNERLYQLRQVTTAEVVVALPPSIGDMPIEEWSEKVFTSWGIGKKDKDNGVLLVIAPEEHRVRIQTGYGAEGVLTDIACNNIIGRTVIPAMRENDINKAVDNATTLIADAMSDPAVAEELRSSQPDNYSGNLTTLSGDVIWEFIQICAGLIWLFALAVFIHDLYAGRKLDNYHRSMMWRGHLGTYIWTSIFSMGAGLIFLLIAYFLYRTSRVRRIKCPTCGARMHRLSEEEDNQLLSDSQDFEEKLKTVDYDVWECDKCGTVERFPYKADQKKYTECPRCHTIAMCLTSDIIVTPATTRQEGRGAKVYECQFCHYRDERPYRIPRKVDESALAAAAILGSTLGRGGSGGSGGGFGGGFGGGATGGGGASGSW